MMLAAAMQSLRPGLRAMVQNELRGGERVVWAAQPVTRYFTPATIAPMLFAIPWTAFSIFWTVSAASGLGKAGGESVMFDVFRYAFPLFGLPFILIGLAMLSAPIWVVRSQRQTAYTITDQRAIVFKPAFPGARKVQSFSPELMASLERTERRDGSGDLVFEKYRQRNGSSVSTVRNGFVGIANVRDVEETLRATLLVNRTRAINPA